MFDLNDKMKVTNIQRMSTSKVTSILRNLITKMVADKEKILKSKRFFIEISKSNLVNFQNWY